MSNATVLSAIDLLLALMTRAAQIQTIIAQAQADGRSDLKPEEWAAINAEDESERQRLVDAIATAKGEGR